MGWHGCTGETAQVRLLGWYIEWQHRTNVQAKLGRAEQRHQPVRFGVGAAAELYSLVAPRVQAACESTERGGVKGHALVESLGLLHLGILGSFWKYASKGYVSQISFGFVSCTCDCPVNPDNFWNSSSVWSRGSLLVLMHSSVKALQTGLPYLTYCCISASFSSFSSPGQRCYTSPVTEFQWF